MASFNKVIMVGNLTRDVELRFTQDGKPVGDFGIAVNKKGKDKETVCFVDVTVWGTLAENCAKYLSVGKPALVEGELVYDTWVDKGSGQTRSKHKITAYQVQFLNAPQNSDDEAPF